MCHCHTHRCRVPQGSREFYNTPNHFSLFVTSLVVLAAYLAARITVPCYHGPEIIENFDQPCCIHS